MFLIGKGIGAPGKLSQEGQDEMGMTVYEIFCSTSGAGLLDLPVTLSVL